MNELLDSFSHIIESHVGPKDRENPKISELEIRIVFKDHSLLEYTEMNVIPLRKGKYAFQWMKPDYQLLVRWDNALHQPHVATHPHPKHVDEEKNILESAAMSLTGGMRVSFARYEAERTSKRTGTPPAQKKAQGFKLGKPENLKPVAIERGRLVRTANARQNKGNVQATELAQFYRSAGLTYAQIADRLLKRQERRTGVAAGADTNACD